MGRSRRRQRRSRDGGVGQHRPEAREQLEPAYVPVRGDTAAGGVREVDGRTDRSPMPLAPVLDLEGLEPWAEISAPALALEDAPTDREFGAEAYHPDQLVLEPLDVSAAGVGGDEAAEIPRSADASVAADSSVETVAPYAPPEPDPADVLYGAARAAADAGRTGEAKALYRELLAQYPRHVRARNNLAILLDQAGDHDTALAELDRALEFDVENSTLLTNRGALLGALGRYAAAERDLRRVLRVEPAHAEALFNLGVVMTKKGLWAEAVPHLRRAIELDPGRGAAYYYLGEALNHVDDLHGALGAYQRAAELQPNNPRALYGLGIIYDRLARPDDAAQMYRRSREVGRR